MTGKLISIPGGRDEEELVEAYDCAMIYQPHPRLFDIRKLMTQARRLPRNEAVEQAEKKLDYLRDKSRNKIEWRTIS